MTDDRSLSRAALSMLPSRPFDAATVAERVAAQRAAAADRYAEAAAGWERVRSAAEGRPDGVLLLTLLALHQPELGQLAEGPTCSSCYIPSYDAEPTPWPCETHEVIREGLAP